MNRLTVPCTLLLASLLAWTAPAWAQAEGAAWQLELSSDASDPSARHEAAYVEVDGLFYLMGGRGSRPVDRYDPVARTWTELGTPPLQVHHVQPVLHDDLVWLLCAFEGNYPNETPVPVIWTYDPALDTWAAGSTIPAARNRGAAGAVVFEDRIYVVGGNTQGHDGGAVPWFDRYDPDLDTWTPLPDAPHARDHFTAAVVGQRLVVAGGRRTEQPNPFLNTEAAVDVYDFSTGTWSSGPQPIPTERAGTMTVARGEHVVVIGGESPGTAHDACEAYDVGTGEWVVLPDLIDSRHSGGAVILDDVVYVASGSGNAGGSPELDTQERLDLTGLLPPSSAQRLANGDFDAGLLGWVDQGDLTLVGAGVIAPPSLEVAAGWAEQTVAAGPHETATLTGSCLVGGTTGAVSLALQFLDGGASLLDEALLPLAPTGGGFLSFALSGTAPTGTTSLRVRALAQGDRTLQVDDLVLVETRPETPRLGVPANPWVLASATTGPVAGATFDPVVDHTTFLPGATQDLLVFGFTPTNVPLVPGTLLVDLGLSLIVPGAAGLPFPLTLPSDPAFYGLPFTVQVVSLAPGGVKGLTNALDLVLQAP